ncbi:MAG: OmpA family protein [Cyclobacteriaceae bacterium]
MRTLVLSISILTLIFTANAQKAVNIVALEHGTTMLETPSSQVNITDRQVLLKHSAGALFDQNPKNKWSSSGVRFPFVFTLELVEEHNIQKFVFDNNCEFYPGIETKDVKVEFSTSITADDFQLVGEYELEKEKSNVFSISPQKARRIRLTILSNYGNKDRVQLSEFKAIGIPSNRIGKDIDINGVWHTNWQDMTFVQEGKSFTGKYVYTSEGRKYKGKVKNGSVDRNVLSFIWDEGNAKGTAKLFMNQEGNKISGYWKNASNPRDFNLWTMTRKVEESKAIEYSEAVELKVVEEEEGIEKEEEPIEKKEEPVLEKEAPVAQAPKEVEEKKTEATPPPTPQVTPTPTVAKETPVAKPETPKIKIGDKEVSEIKTGETIVMKNIIFRQGAASVSPESYPELNNLYDYLKANKKAKIKVNGHTDKIGDPKKNILLSQARANAIKKYLVNKGINKNRILAVGLGDTKTICPTPCNENRRVDFVLVEN